ncbi:MAG: hypothetical protein IKE92_15240, partial [Clostridiales bacterium]|nr:hypothetical protein [Clostridiales bacterium]
ALTACSHRKYDGTNKNKRYCFNDSAHFHTSHITVFTLYTTVKGVLLHHPRYFLWESAPLNLK